MVRRNTLQKALRLLIGVDQRPLSSLSERELIALESQIGASLFGPIPKGNRREFFCLDEKTWIWHEERYDAASRSREVFTIRYEIRPEGILKAQEGAKYSFIKGEELQNLTLAIKMYHERVVREVYGKELVAQ